MFLNLIILAVLLGTVTCQSTEVKLKRLSLPLRNKSADDTITSPIGKLKHIQTLRLDAEGSSGQPFESLTSLLVSPDGSELLATADIARGSFVTLAIQPTVGDQYDVPEATVYPMRDSDRGILDASALSMTVDGRYRTRGRGNLLLSIFRRPTELLRFRRGVRSTRSTALDVSDFFSICGPQVSLEAIIHLNRLRRFRGNLLGFCSFPSRNSSIPRSNPAATVYPVGVYDGRRVRSFFVESFDAEYRPTAAAELNNGDMMISFAPFARFVTPLALRIGYITADKLREGIVSGRTLNPVIIADLPRNDGYNFAFQAGPAVRQDRRSRRIFVHTVNDNTVPLQRLGERVNLLTTFEWIPK